MPLTPWKVISSRYVLRDPWMTLRADRCQMANGVTLDPYYVQEPPDWVHVVAFDHQDRLLVVRQYRHGAGLICAELPAGGIEPGETPQQAAARELLEEAGCAAQAFAPLPVLSPNPSCYSNKIHAFIATGVRPVQTQDLDDTEEIEFEFMDVNKVITLIEDGGFHQALHVASLLLALRAR